jgi:O-antigen/teichoic acid export membrane protein
MIVLVIGLIFVSGNVLAAALQSVRKTKIFIISSSAAPISNFILSFLLIPRMHL